MRILDRLRGRRAPVPAEDAPSPEPSPPAAEVAPEPPPDPTQVWPFPAADDTDLEVELRWAVVEASETAEHPGLLLDLMDKRIDGITLRGVFTPEELARAVPALDALRPRAHPQPFGAMLGMPIYQRDPADGSGYLASTQAARPLYLEAFGFDPHERVADVLAPMVEGRRFVPAVEDGIAHNPGNVRWYDPGKGGLRTHAGSEFVDIHEDGAAKVLFAVNEIRDHMSYFVVLRPSEEGGALSVFDRLWVDRPDDFGDWDEANRDDRVFDRVPRRTNDFQAGEMVIFGGGWRFHRVDPIGGTIPRLTYGGFGRLGRDGETLHMWC